MVIKISYENEENNFTFSDLKPILNSVVAASNHVQIHMGNIQTEEQVQTYYDLESKLNGRLYYHYFYLDVLGETSIVTFQLANLLKNLCELLYYDIELFAKCID